MSQKNKLIVTRNKKKDTSHHSYRYRYQSSPIIHNTSDTTPLNRSSQNISYTSYNTPTIDDNYHRNNNYYNSRDYTRNHRREHRRRGGRNTDYHHVEYYPSSINYEYNDANIDRNTDYHYNTLPNITPITSSISNPNAWSNQMLNTNQSLYRSLSDNVSYPRMQSDIQYYNEADDMQRMYDGHNMSSSVSVKNEDQVSDEIKNNSITFYSILCTIGQHFCFTVIISSLPTEGMTEDELFYWMADCHGFFSVRWDKQLSKDDDECIKYKTFARADFVTREAAEYAVFRKNHLYLGEKEIHVNLKENKTEMSVDMKNGLLHAIGNVRKYKEKIRKKRRSLSKNNERNQRHYHRSRNRSRSRSKYRHESMSSDQMKHHRTHKYYKHERYERNSISSVKQSSDRSSSKEESVNKIKKESDNSRNTSLVTVEKHYGPHFLQNLINSVLNNECNGNDIKSNAESDVNEIAIKFGKEMKEENINRRKAILDNDHISMVECESKEQRVIRERREEKHNYYESVHHRIILCEYQELQSLEKRKCTEYFKCAVVDFFACLKMQSRIDFKSSCLMQESRDREYQLWLELFRMEAHMTVIDQQLIALDEQKNAIADYEGIEENLMDVELIIDNDSSI